MLVIGTGIHKILVPIAYWEDTDQTASDMCLRCLSMPFWQVTSVQNFRTSTVYYLHNITI